MAPSKSFPQGLHLKLCKILQCNPLCTWNCLAQLPRRQAKQLSKLPGGHHTPPSATCFPDSLFDSFLLARPPLLPSTMHSSVFLVSRYYLMVHPVSQGATPVESLLLVLGTSKAVAKNPNTPHAILNTNHVYPNIWLNHNTTQTYT